MSLYAACAAAGVNFSTCWRRRADVTLNLVSLQLPWWAGRTRSQQNSRSVTSLLPAQKPPYSFSSSSAAFIRRVHRDKKCVFVLEKPLCGVSVRVCLKRLKPLPLHHRVWLQISFVSNVSLASLPLVLFAWTFCCCSPLTEEHRI